MAFPSKRTSDDILNERYLHHGGSRCVCFCRSRRSPVVPTDTQYRKANESVAASLPRSIEQELGLRTQKQNNQPRKTRNTIKQTDAARKATRLPENTFRNRAPGRHWIGWRGLATLISRLAGDFLSSQQRLLLQCCRPCRRFCLGRAVGATRSGRESCTHTRRTS